MTLESKLQALVAELRDYRNNGEAMVKMESRLRNSFADRIEALLAEGDTDYTKLEDELGQGQIELASELCAAQKRIRTLLAERQEPPLNDALRIRLAGEFHVCGQCGSDGGTFDEIRKSGYECCCYEAADLVLRVLAAAPSSGTGETK